MALAASACSAMTAPRLCIPDEASCHSIVYEHMSTICTHLHLRVLSFPYQSSRLQLADEQAGGEQADALGQDVLGEDVDEGGQQDEGHGGLVDEEEGDQLGHGRLEDGLAVLATLMPLSMYSMRVYHLLGADLGGLLLLLAGERGAGHDSRADGGGRAESGPGEGAEEASGVHRGRPGGRGQRCAGAGRPIAAEEPAGAELTHWGRVCGPGRCAVMELRVEVDGRGEPKALAELPCITERAATSCDFLANPQSAQL